MSPAPKYCLSAVILEISKSNTLGKQMVSKSFANNLSVLNYAAMLCPRYYKGTVVFSTNKVYRGKFVSIILEDKLSVASTSF